MILRAIALRLVPLLALGIGAGGCASAPPPVATAPRDPTPLAKCRVGASQVSPLVTEWPSSEKAHLESMLADGAVAVAYTGCELRILDACKVEGNYSFRRTTLATDTLEITDEDELYAKLPIGAVSLEGEFKRSGRLALHTSVAGQMRLDRASGFTVGRTGVCAAATHVITAISVGAYRLASGGAVSAGAGASVGLLKGGGKVGRAEETLRSAGDPATCLEEPKAAAPAPPAPRKAPLKGGKPGASPLPGVPAEDPPATVTNAQCRSPIQVFLTQVEHRDELVAPPPHVETARSAAPLPTLTPDAPAARPLTPFSFRLPWARSSSPPAGASAVLDYDSPSPTALRVNFPAPIGGEKWLLRVNDTTLCELPCTKYVKPDNALYLQLDADRLEKVVRIDVPRRFDFSGGRSVDAEVVPARGSKIGATITSSIGGGSVFAGIMVAIFYVGPKTGAVNSLGYQVDNSSCFGVRLSGTGPPSGANASCTAPAALMISGGVVLAAGVTWLVYSKGPRIVFDISPAASAGSMPKIEPVPGLRLGLSGSTLAGEF